MENEFLTDEERKLVAWILKTHENVLAFDETQKGRFREDIFPPVIFPVIEHVPWAAPSLPIPPAIVEEVVRVIKAKVHAGTYEPSTSSYRHQWFCVAKKDGSIRIVHNLGPLNRVTIKDAGQMPVADHFAEVCAGRGIYTSIDLFVGFDHRTIAEESRDLTAFDTPLGTHRLTVLPQGWTNSPTIFHADVAWIIQDLIPKVMNLADDIQGLGARTRYEKDDGTFEATEANPKVRRFVWEHLEDINKLLHVLRDAGATISAQKLHIAVPEAVVMGQLMTYDGRKPERTKVAKIESWPPCMNVTEVRGFLGTAGTVRNWIQDFARIAHPLVELTKKGVEWRWTEVEQEAMDTLKAAVVSSEAIRPIDYQSSNEVILAVDSSHIACGYILLQLDDEKRRRPARFGSITFNEREARYSQAKLELYGLFRSIHAVKLWIIGVANLTVETDAKYIKGMLNHPDMHPNAAVNRWISAILLFPFKLVHVPAAKHQGPDGLSRRRATEDDGDDLGDAEEWIDEVLNCGVWVSRVVESETRKVLRLTEEPVVGAVWVLSGEAESAVIGKEIEREKKNEWNERDNELRKIKVLLEGVGVTEERVPAAERERLERLAILKEMHDNTGHHGVYSTRRLVLDRFWWPAVHDDLRWYIKTCHECQLMNTQKVVIPPVVSAPATLFRVVYIDTMHLPPSNGYTYLVQARCSLSGWVEFRPLRKESARTIGAFIFEELLCRWGRLEKLVTDNGTAYVAALQYLEDRYDLSRVPISPYNSKANGAVETTHRTVRDALVKVTAGVGGMKKWSEHVHHVMWADRITTRKRTGFSPFFAAHGVEPLLPFDILHATFLLSDIQGPISDADLLAIRARQLERREEDLQLIRDRVIASRFASIEAFMQKFKNTIVDYDFKPGDLVLVLNKKIEPELGRKAKPRYYGPMVVVSRGSGGAYRLAEVNGAVSKLKYAAFRLIPYYRRYTSHIDVTELLDAEDEVGDVTEDV
ncbi:hypothetical protein NMY22_g18261 [Coprinellus aureogranulatus]|nr:hypothetical protein NMY22_g18261 [Coprinellus aureogranulatus]